MKIFVLLVVAMLAACVKSDKDMIMKIFQECKDKVGATDDDAMKIMIHAPLDNQQQKCLFSCVMGATGIVSRMK